MTERSDADVDLVDDEFERLGRLAGAELRQQPPADGSGTVLRSAHRRRAKVATVAVGVTVAIVATGLFVANSRIQDEPAPIATVPPTLAPVVPTTGPFVGIWLSTDTDGSSQTMEIRATATDEREVIVRDKAGACSGAPSTMVGTGWLTTDDTLVILRPELTCDDGTTPVIGPPPQGQLADFTFVHDPATDQLVDGFGVLWRRDADDDPSPATPTSGAMWPQSSVDELREAQELADAGDPAYAWQVDERLGGDEWWAYLREPGSEIVERFLREELGWDQFLFNPYQGDDGDGAADGVIGGLVYLRCAPGETNPLYPITPDGHQEAPGAELCAPTIDELRYETVSLDLSQPDRRGPDGIWVVSRWTMTEPFTQADPQIVEAEATARLEDFLLARIEGEGAEGYVEVTGDQGALGLDEVPLLYATTAGARYERSELERVSGPRWPYGEMEFTIRLFANGGETVVEQPIAWSDVGGARISLVHDATDTTENGEPLAVRYVFFDGEVFVSAPDPWELSPWHEVALVPSGQSTDQRIELVGDPLPVATGCERGPAPTDASELARSLRSDLDLQVTAPSAVTVGGVEGLAMDVTVAPAASVCDVIGSPLALTQNDSYRGPRPPGVNLDQGSRMRLYLIDLPEGSSTRILSIAVVAPEARFDDVIEAAAPIIQSIEFRQRGS